LASGGKKFLVFDINGNYIKSTISQIEFAKEIGVSSSTIQNVLNGEKHSTNGYILIIEDEFTEELLTYKIKMSNQCYKPFIVLDKQNKPMGIWYDKKTCSETIRLDLRSIQRQLKKNRFSKYAREYTLFYLDSIPDEFQDIKLKINNNEIPFCESKRMERYYKEVI
jgi:transcriptional regulator with XRE-family HTH domain